MYLPSGRYFYTYLQTGKYVILNCNTNTNYIIFN